MAEPREALAAARMLYLLGKSVDEIQTETGLDKKVINHEITRHGGWKLIKKDADLAAIHLYMNSKVEFYEATAGLALSCMMKGLSDLRKQIENGKGLSIAEMSMLSGLVANIHKLGQLEQGKPTEITKRSTISVEEAKRIIASDPILTTSVTHEPIDEAELVYNELAR